MLKPLRVSGAEAIRALEKLGFVRIRQKGSHIILDKETGAGAIGLCRACSRRVGNRNSQGILKQARVDPDEFAKML
jgi:predicted RNA binding protein YcfA (HicA-like mRNA interferase family)